MSFGKRRIVLHELEFGLRLLPRGRRREELQSAVAKYVTKFEDRILPLDRRAAEAAAEFRVRAQQSGRTLHLGDALIAGTAKAHDMAVATRNVTDFDGLEVAVINPVGVATIPDPGQSITRKSLNP